MSLECCADVFLPPQNERRRSVFHSVAEKCWRKRARGGIAAAHSEARRLAAAEKLLGLFRAPCPDLPRPQERVGNGTTCGMGDCPQGTGKKVDIE